MQVCYGAVYGSFDMHNGPLVLFPATFTSFVLGPDFVGCGFA